MIAEAAQDPRWQQAVDQAQTLLGPAPPWLLAQLGALFVHDIANSTGIAPNEVTAEQLNHQLTDLGQHASNAQRRHARDRRP